MFWKLALLPSGQVVPGNLFCWIHYIEVISVIFPELPFKVGFGDKPVKWIEQNILQYYFYLMTEAKQPSEIPVANILHTVDTVQHTFCLCKLDSSV